MAIDALYLKVLVETIKLRRSTIGDRRLSALALAYPDLVVPRVALVEMLGASLVDGLPERPDERWAAEWLAQFAPWRALVAAHLWASLAMVA